MITDYRRRVAFQCYDDGSDARRQDACYSDQWNARYKTPQFQCPSDASAIPPILPLTADLEAVKRAIRSLQAGDGVTNSTLGVAWGHRLLAPAWREIWGGATHPVDQADGVQKALVLLTDGDDNYPDRGTALVTARRNQACTAAKNNGISVFTIAAMDARKVGDLAEPLRQCSSQADDPAGTYVFVNNNTAEELQAAFQQIAAQLVHFRRVH